MTVARLFHATSLGWAAVAIIALPQNTLSAVEPSDITGSWVMSVDTCLTNQSVDLEIDHRSNAWNVSLRSDAGSITTDRVSLENDVLCIQYGAKPLDVRIELRAIGETMRGSLITGERHLLRRKPIAARRAPITHAAAAVKTAAEPNKTVEERRPFLGAWEVSLRRVNPDSTNPIRFGMVVAELDAQLILGHNDFGMKTPQKRVNHVLNTPDGLRWILDGGIFGPLNVDLVSEGERLNVLVTGGDQEPFLQGTAIRKPSASDVGIDRQQLIQQPGTKLVGNLGGDARVSDVYGDQLIIQHREVVSRMIKGDPLLVPFEWFRLPQKSGWISAETNFAWSVIGSTVQSWDIRNPQTPVELGSCEFPGNPPSLLHRSGRWLIAANWNGRADTQQIHLIDVSDPGRPELLTSHSTPKGLNNYDVAVAGSTLYVANAGGLRITELSDPQSPTTQGNFKARGRWVRGVDVVGTNAYIATSMHGGASWMQVVDVSDATAPIQTGIFRSTGGAQDVSVSGDLAVLADRADGIVVLDVSKPQNVRRLGYYQTEGRANGVEIFGKLAFVSVESDAGSSVLQVIRYTD